MTHREQISSLLKACCISSHHHCCQCDKVNYDMHIYRTMSTMSRCAFATMASLRMNEWWGINSAPWNKLKCIGFFCFFGITVPLTHTLRCYCISQHLMFCLPHASFSVCLHMRHIISDQGGDAVRLLFPSSHDQSDPPLCRQTWQIHKNNIIIALYHLSVQPILGFKREITHLQML